MAKTSNPILNAVLSRLIADRDEDLVKFDLIINKNQSDSGISGIVSEAYFLAKQIAQTEVTIDWVNNLIESNDIDSAVLMSKIKELQENIKTEENNTNNNNNGNNS